MVVSPSTLMTGMFLEHLATKQIFKVTHQNQFMVYLKNISTDEIVPEYKTDITPKNYKIVDVKGNYTF